MAPFGSSPTPNLPGRPSVAVVGTGISGLAAAYYLQDDVDLTVFEADSRLGGHTATVAVEHNGDNYQIDTGFIVFNDWTYPNFKALLADCEVAYQPTSMGFSVTCQRSGLEYCGSGLGGFFAQKRRWLDVKHWGLLRDIVRFNRVALSKLASGELTNDVSLGELVKDCGASQYFADNYLVPMVAAIWSKSETASLAMPARFFASFFKNHGLLSLTDRPQWHVIAGGSKNYIPALTAKYKQAIRLNSPVERVIREGNQVGVVVNGQVQWFDHLILACHSDQALALLEQPTEAERKVLGAIEYQNNAVVLHTDVGLLPKERATWSSWNYLLNRDHQRAVLTYNMNILQGLAPKDGTTFCVTLNDTAAIDPDKILGQFEYAHPVFNHAAVEAQERWSDINGVANISYCGAYWRNGFHEDGVHSALRVAKNLQANLLPQFQAIATA